MQTVIKRSLIVDKQRRIKSTINRRVVQRQHYIHRRGGGDDAMRLFVICIQLLLGATSSTITTTSTQNPHQNVEIPHGLTRQQLNIYYDLRDGAPLDFDVEAHAANSGGGAGQLQPEPEREQQERRLNSRNRSNGCSCQAMTCGCCTGINIQQFNFNREGCMNFTYDPGEFSLTMDMFMNSNPVYTNTISAKNPPPLCLPFGVPLLPSVAFCARLFDVHTQGQNLQMCLDFETRVQQAPVFVLHFECMRMGAAGLALVKPGDTLPPVEDILPVEPPSPQPSPPPSQQGSLTNPFFTVTSTTHPPDDIYDEVID